MDGALFSDMPRIPDELTYGISFTYRTRADAENNARHGGTAFLVSKVMEGIVAENGGPAYLIYAVTNYHVACCGFPVIRIHREDAIPQILDLAPTDWVPHPNGDDLAIAFISDKLSIPGMNNAQVMSGLKFVPTHRFLTPKIATDNNVGIGDEIFMLGRFINLQGNKTNLAPALRLGNISMMPQPLWNSVTNADQESFGVEMRSRTGFSGSPVAVYRTDETMPIAGKALNQTQRWWYLLGVNWGFVYEKDTNENTWLNGVVPAWKILELLEEPALADKHKLGTQYFKELAKRQHPTAAPAVALPEGAVLSSTDENPNHREDFTSLANAAARKQKPTE